MHRVSETKCEKNFSIQVAVADPVHKVNVENIALRQ